MRSYSNSRPQQGFTIVELMIATAVFAVVLVVITTGVLTFSRQYYKGVITSNTQATTRQIMDDVVRSIQFNPGAVVPLKKLNTTDVITPSTPTYGYCVGDSTRYSFSQNWQVLDNGAVAVNHQSKHGLIKDIATGCNASSTAMKVNTVSSALGTDEREELGERMRVVKFEVANTGVSDTYNVTLRIAYGDDDLLCSPSIASGAGSCGYYGAGPFNAMVGYDDLKCKSRIGSEFCAVSELSTVVSKRVD
jgi:prepilin-type N-terminal cleavage/methylation domain-containing protein